MDFDPQTGQARLLAVVLPCAPLHGWAVSAPPRILVGGCLERDGQVLSVDPASGDWTVLPQESPYPLSYGAAAWADGGAYIVAPPQPAGGNPTDGPAHVLFLRP